MVTQGHVTPAEGHDRDFTGPNQSAPDLLGYVQAVSIAQV